MSHANCIRLQGSFLGLFFILSGMVCYLHGQPVKNQSAAPVERVFEAKKSGHQARLAIRTRPFRKEEHRIEPNPDGGFRIDGKIAMGTDGGIPKVEIERMDLLFDGNRVTIPAKLYRDVFEPNLIEKHFAVRLGDDLASLFVFLGGSDGAGSYQLIWVFRRDGNHSRFSVPCADCRFIDFESGGLDAVTINE